MKKSIGFNVAIGDGCTGLLHKKELAWNKSEQKELFDSIGVGDKVHVVVKAINPERRFIYLTLKRPEEYPWVIFENEHPVGSSVEVKVTKYLNDSIIIFHQTLGFIKLPYSLDWMVSLGELKENYPKQSKLSVRIRPGTEGKHVILEPEIMVF